MLTFLLAWVSSSALASPFEWQLDPKSGYAVAQLTQWDPSSSALTQDNYALYYHQPNHSADGRTLIYQHGECVCSPKGCGISPNSLVYRQLDLENGVETDLFGLGLANGGVAHGNHLYAATRATPQGDYQRIERIDLGNGAIECLTPLPAGEDLIGSITASADGSALIYQTLPSGQGGGGTWAHFVDPNLTQTCPSSHSDTLLHPHDPKINHVQFSPTDPSVFTFIDGAGTRLSKVGIGTVTPTGSTWNRLTSDQAYLDSFYGFPHPFWGAYGYLWTDAIGPSSSTTYEESFVRLSLDEETGWVESYGAVEIGPDDWHHHQSGQRSFNWFVGDGQNLESRGDVGVPRISLFYLQSPWNTNTIGGLHERYDLADSLGAKNSGTGNLGANAHLLPTLDGVVFSAPYDLGTGEASDVSLCPASRNVFLIKIPPHLKARLDDYVNTSYGSGGHVDGPFKHANRLSVSADGAAWSIDFGQGGPTPTLGDGVEDRLAGSIRNSPDHAGLADLDGDDVDDRLAFTRTATGWRIDVAYSPYDGLLPTTAVVADTHGEFDDPSPLAPIFGDLDGDGRDDMVHLDNTGTELVWQGRFSADTGLPPSPYEPSGLGWETASPFGDIESDEYFFVVDVDGDGYADRITVRPQGSSWRWSLDLSTPTGFGDGQVDDVFDGGDSSTDTPLVADVDADGRGDIVIARQQGSLLRWYVNPSSAGGFGSSWDPPVGRGYFGSVGQPLIGFFGRFHTVQP